jgi:hypothetical protein
LRLLYFETHDKVMRLVFVAIVCCVSPLFAQERTRFGVSAGYSFGRPASINRKLGALETFGTNGQGTSFEKDLEFGAHMEFPKMLGEHNDLAILLAYIRGSGEFKSNSFDYYSSRSIYLVTSKDERIHVEGSLRHDLLPWLFASSGLWASYRIYDSLLEERFDNGIAIDSTKKSGRAIATSRFHFGIPITVGSRFALSRQISLEPEVHARIDLGEIFRGFSQDAFSVGGRIAVTYDLNAPREAPPPIAEPPAHLTATVHFEVSGISTKYASARESDTIYHRYVMLPTAFDRNTTPLPAAGASLQDILAEESAIIIERSANTRDSIRLFTPYADQWKETSAVIPNITIAKYIESQVGVRSWSIDIRRDGATVATLTEDSTLSHTALDRIFQYNRGRASDTIVAALKATDVKGNIAFGRDTLIVTPATESATSASTKDQFYIICDSTISVPSWRPTLVARAAHTAAATSNILISPLSEGARSAAHQISAELLTTLAREHIAVRSVHEVSSALAKDVPLVYRNGVLIEVVTPTN